MVDRFFLSKSGLRSGEGGVILILRETGIKCERTLAGYRTGNKALDYELFYKFSVVVVFG